MAVSFDEIYAAQWWTMLRIAIGLVDDRASAEDVVQDAFAALYRKWPSIDPAATASYLRTSVVNASRDVLRRRRTARLHLRAATVETEEPSDHTVLLTAEHQLVRDAMRRLPERQREVLTLRFLTELDDAEIAAATGLSAGGGALGLQPRPGRAPHRLEGQL